MSNTYNRIRIACDMANPYKPLINLTTRLQPEIPRGRAVRIDVAVYDFNTFQPSIPQITGMTLEIKATTRTGAPIISKTISSFSDIALGQWTDGSAQHGTFQLSASDTNAIDMASALSKELWFVITATTATAPITLAAGTVNAVEDGGVISGNTPTAGDPTYLTADQTLAIIQSATGEVIVTSQPNGTRKMKLFLPDDPADGDIQFLEI